jgi:hypothetical protein
MERSGCPAINLNQFPMIRLACLFLLLALAPSLEAQLLKDIGRGIKRDAEYRVERKARDAVKTGIDSLEKKAKDKKGRKKDAQKTGGADPSAGTIQSTSKETPEEKPTAGEGFITLKLSTPITLKGLTVTISGESIKHQKWNSVRLLVKAPNDEEEIKVPLNDSGRYSIVYNKLPDDGDYFITAISSDGKARATEHLWVKDWDNSEEETKDLKELTGTAFNRLKEKAEDLSLLISAGNRAALAKKINEVKERVDALHKFLEDLVIAKNEISKLYKAGRVPTKNIRNNLVVLNQMLAAKTEEIRKIKAATGHEAFDNSVCEYIAMVNEACAAFSTLTNFWTRSVSEIIKNIMIDKVAPKVTEFAVSGGPAAPIFTNEYTGDELTWGAKESSKILLTAHYDMEGLTKKLGIAGFAGDVVQFATDVLMKFHCGIFKGTLTHNYRFRSLNARQSSWWEYSVTSGAVLTLRYPLSSSGIIKMKGTLEGNAKYFHFNADPSENPDYVHGTAGKVETMVLKNITPFSLFINAANYDGLGFGMAARAIVTPAYFLVPIDAEFNTQTNKIKIYINDALVDFLPWISNKQIFIQLGASLISGLKIMDYPIAKAGLTLKATFKEDNEFDVRKDAKGNLFFSDRAERKIYSDDGERIHELNAIFSVKKE